MSSFAKIAAQLSSGVKREVLSPGKLRLILSWGFPYEAFGPTVTVKPWHILNLVESGRAFSFNRMPNYPGDPFLQIEDLYSNYGVFQGSARLTIAKEMYDIAIPKTPLTLQKELVYVGKSSLNLHTRVMLPSQELTLATCEVQSVLVDRKSRRPAPFPDWWREKFGGFTAPERQLKVKMEKAPEPTGEGAEVRSSGDSRNVGITGQNRPPVMNKNEYADPSQPVPQPDQNFPIADTVTSVPLTITGSDVDSYGHVNWASFLKYCVDAMMMGYRSEVRDTLQSHAMKSADISYVSEGSIGQRITVKYWKDSSVPRAVHFSITDSDSEQLVVYAFLQYYSLQEVRVPIAKL